MSKPVVFRFAADVKSLKQGLSETERDLRQFGSHVTKVGAGLTAGLTVPLAALGVSAVNAASDLDEAINVTRLTFGEAAASIEQFGDASSDALGQSKRAALQAATTFGGLLRGVGESEQAAAEMSITLTKLASDLGSAFNTAPEDAVTALGAALRGESEPIRRYNVLLDDASVRQRAVEMGLAGTTREVDNQDKVLARYNLLLEQTALIQGDFGNTADGLANSQRRLSAEWEDARAALGESLLPAAQSLVGVTTDLLQVFTAAPPEVQKSVVAVGALAATIGPLLVVSGSLLRNWQTIQQTAPALAAKLGKGAGVAGGFAVAAVAASAFGRSLEGLTGSGANDLSDIARDLELLARTGTAAGLAEAVGGIDGIVRSLDALADPSLSDNVSTGISKVVGAAGGLLGFQGTASQMAAELDAVDDALASMVESGNADMAAALFDRIATAAGEQGIPVEAVTRGLDDYTAALDLSAATSDDAADSTEDLGRAHRTTADQVKSLSERIKEQTDRQREAASPALAALRSVSRYEDAITNLNKVQKDSTSTTQDLEDANLDLLDALLDMQVATSLTEDNANGFRSALAELEQQGYLSTEQMRRLNQMIEGLPDNKTITVGVVSQGKVFDDPLDNPLTREASEALKGGFSASSRGDTNIVNNIYNPRPHAAEEDLLLLSRQMEFLR